MVYGSAINVAVVFLFTVVLEVILQHEALGAERTWERQPLQLRVMFLLVTDKVHIVFVDLAASVTGVAFVTHVGGADVLLQ